MIIRSIALFARIALFSLLPALIVACSSSDDSDSTDTTNNDLENNAPTFANASEEVDVAENVVGVFYTASANDTDGDNLTYSLSGGADQGAFNINSSSGALSFINSPDYEVEADADKNNIYAVEISASDGEASASMSLQVTLSDVPAPDAPTNVQASSGDSTATLSWDSVSAAETYHIYLAQASGVGPDNYSELTEGLNATTHTYDDLANGVTYYFVVVASSSEGNSSVSTEVSTTPAATTTSDELTLALDLSSSDYASLMVTEDLAVIEEQEAQGMVQAAASKLSFANGSLQAQSTSSASGNNLFALDDADNVHSVFTNDGIYVLYVANDPTGTYAYVALDIDQSAEFVKLSQCALYRVELATNKVFCAEPNYAPANLDSGFTAALEYQGLKPVQFSTSDDLSNQTTSLSSVYYLGRSFAVSNGAISWDSASNPIIRKLDIASDGSVSDAETISSDVDTIKSFALLADGLLVYHFSNDLSAGLKLYDNGSTNIITDSSDGVDSDYFYSAGDASDVLMYGKVGDSERIMRFMRSAGSAGVNKKELPSEMINGESTVRVITADDGFVYALTHDESAAELNFYQLMPFDDTPMFSIDVSSSNLAQALDNKVQLYINHAYYVDTDSHLQGNHNDRDVIKIVKKHNGETRTLLNDEAWSQRYDIHKWKQIGDEIHFAGFDYSISKMVYGRVDLTAVENNAADSEILSVSEISSVLGVSSDILDLEEIRPDAPNKYEAGNPKLEFHADERNPYAVTIEFTKYMNKDDVANKTTINSNSSATTDHLHVWYYKTLHIVYDQDDSNALTDYLLDDTAVSISLDGETRDYSGFFLSNGMDPEELAIAYTVNPAANQAPIALIASADVDLTGYEISAGEILALSAANSYDPDGDDIYSYSWSVDPATNASLSADALVETALTVASNASGTLTIHLEVCDSDGLCGTDSKTLSIIAEAALLPAPTNLGGDVSGNSIALYWEAVDGAASYKLYRDSSALAADITDTSYTDSGLAYSSQYTYHVSAVDAAGVEGYLSAELAITTEADTSSGGLLPAPTNLSGEVSGNSISLQWDAVADAAGYNIYDAATDERLIALDSGATLEHSFTDLAYSTEYIYQVAAFDADNVEGAKSSIIGLTTEAEPTLPAPANLSGEVSGNSISLQWDAVADAAGYNIYDAATDELLIAIESGATLSHSFTDLAYSTEYSYQISAIDANDIEGAKSASISFTTGSAEPPAAPTGLSGSVSANSVSLQWSAVAAAASYKIYRDGSGIDDTLFTSFSDTGLLYNTTYEYQVSSVDSSGSEGEKSAVLELTTDYRIAAPANFRATQGDNEVRLDWDAIDEVIGYRVYREGSLYATIDTNTYTDRAVSNGLAYSYGVSGFTAENEASATATLDLILVPSVPAIASAETSDSSVVLSWSAVNHALGYYVYRDGSAIGESNSTSFTDSGVSNGATHSYTLSSVNAGGSSEQSSAYSVTLAPDAPAGLAASIAYNQVDLSWQAANGATAYLIYRDSELLEELSDASATTSYSDLTASNGSTYSYQIQAQNAGGTSALSASVEAALPWVILDPEFSAAYNVETNQIDLAYTLQDDASYQLIRSYSSDCSASAVSDCAGGADLSASVASGGSNDSINFDETQYYQLLISAGDQQQSYSASVVGADELDSFLIEQSLLVAYSAADDAAIINYSISPNTSYSLYAAYEAIGSSTCSVATIEQCSNSDGSSAWWIDGQIPASETISWDKRRYYQLDISVSDSVVASLKADASVSDALNMSAETNDSTGEIVVSISFPEIAASAAASYDLYWSADASADGSDKDTWSDLDSAGSASTTATEHKVTFSSDQDLYFYLSASKAGVESDFGARHRLQLTSAADASKWLSAGDAPWTARYGHTSVVFQDKMWVIGGAGDSGRSSDVWSSTDGFDWQQVKFISPWAARSSHTSVVYDAGDGEKIWILGGYDGSSRRNDVWSSADGETWEEVSNSSSGADWSTRYDHTTTVFDDGSGAKLWLLGGYDGSYLNDVWSSADGASWEQVDGAADWSARGGHGTVSFGEIEGFGNDMLIVKGGYTNVSDSYCDSGYGCRDVWASENGSDWQLLSTNAWGSRNREFSSVVLDGNIWVLGGADDYRNCYYDCNNDVYYSNNGSSWSTATSDAAWQHRAQHTSVAFANKLWVLGGYASPYDGIYNNHYLNSEVWYSGVSVASFSFQ